ncbi:hypothetical protein JRQ81_019952 [Phrynocephalus forsythii]|uniref:Charged multivesicular body protein 2b n=1 Tax=Phrynocephalus forsythii TaxID=171643 RepID=A0A9Q0XMV7_9SAUR|nr:hypothetical protein JRQ81_019952 [Phrynocephalus forsythii]
MPGMHSPSKVLEYENDLVTEVYLVEYLIKQLPGHLSSPKEPRNATGDRRWAAAAAAATMASLFKKKTVDDIIKEQNKELRGTQRAIVRDRAALERQEKQLELEIKKMAKTGNKEACKVLAKQLVQLRKQKTRTYAVSSKVTSMSAQTKLMNSQMKMAGAMSTTAKTMQTVNKKMDPQKTLQTMQNFQKENMKMEMTEEMSESYFWNNVSYIYP